MSGQALEIPRNSRPLIGKTSPDDANSEVEMDVQDDKRIPYAARVAMKIDPTVNGVAVECSMRLEHGTLSHLPHSTFVAEVATARDCERMQPGWGRRIADSYGMTAQYDLAETYRAAAWSAKEGQA